MNLTVDSLPHVLCLPSKDFKWSQILDFGVKSEVSFYGGDGRVVVKLVVWCLGVSVQIDSTDGMGGRGVE